VRAFVKPAEGGIALFLTNTGTGTASAAYPLSQLGITSARVTSRNIWTGRTTAIGRVVVTLAAGASAMLVLR
jgi:Alpha galactosidase C-terminal beta sandwich domain